MLNNRNPSDWLKGVVHPKIENTLSLPQSVYYIEMQTNTKQLCNYYIFIMLINLKKDVKISGV